MSCCVANIVSPPTPTKHIIHQRDNMGIMLEKTTNMKKRPLHHTHTIDDGNDGLISKRSKRGKDLASFPTLSKKPPSSSSMAMKEHPTPCIVEGSHPPPSIAATTPTADDFANLLFYESPEEGGTTSSHTITQEGSCKRSSSSSSSSRKRKKQCRRRISFGAAIPTIHYLSNVPTVQDMTSKEKSTLWYDRSNLEEFKSYAQSCIQDVRNLVLSEETNDKTNTYSKDRNKFRSLMSSYESTLSSSIRGLEHRIFRRKQTRQSLMHAVLECQNHINGLAKFGHSMGSEESILLLSKVSRERSVKARATARVDAKDDYTDIYG